MDPKAQDWPDATRSLLQAPVRDRIEAHAAILLSRALNGGRVVGFIGAGLSMAYGRVSWRDLVRINQDRVLKRAATYQHEEPVRELTTLLTQHKIEVTGNSRGEDFVQAFQLTEQLDGLLPRGPNSASFRRGVAGLVADDRGNLKHIVERSFGDEELLPALNDVGQEAKSKWAALRHRTFLETLIAKAKAAGADHDVCDAAAALLPGGSGPLRPYHRFVIDLVIRLLPPQPTARWFTVAR